MGRSRKSQAAAIRFGPALKAAFLCLLIAGSAIGYVWQKSEISRLGRQIAVREKALNQLKSDNKMLSDQIAVLRSPVMIDRRVRELNLGLVPAQPGQKIVLPEPGSGLAKNENQPQQFAQRPAVETTQ